MSDISLPEGWCLPSFDDVVLNVNGARKPVSLKIREGIKGEYPYYGATGQIDALNDFTHEGEHILIGEDGANLLSKSKDLAFIVDGQFWVNNHAHAVKCVAGMPAKFVSSYINSLDLSPWVSGSAQPKLTKGNLARILTPLPPLAEQKVIADKLDTLLAQVEATKTRLERIPNILKRFRQSVLAAAVSGKLTEPSKGDPSIKKTVSFEEILNDKRQLSYGVLKPGDLEPDGVPMIRVMDIGEWGRFNDTEVFKISQSLSKQYKRTEVEKGDIVLSVMATIGRPAIIPERFAGANVNRALAVIKLKEGMIPEYVQLQLLSPFFQAAFVDKQIGSAQKRINLSDLRKFDIWVPSNKEQTEIVRRVEELFAFVDSIEQKNNTALEQVNNLTQSILAKAFRGELTANWRAANPDLISGENSAEALLEKIKIECEAMKPAKKARKGKKV